MSMPTIEPTPDENISLPPARRRQRQRMLVPSGSGEQANFLHELSQRVAPTFDFFLFSLLAGLILGTAFLIDSHALVFLAILLAPFMAPMLGISLGTITGATRFVLQSAASLSIGSLIVFLCGLMTGLIVPLLPGLLPAHSGQVATEYSQFSWPAFLVLSLGAGFSAYLIVRKPNQKPLVSSVAIAYGLYLPVGAAGFRLSSGIDGLWLNALAVFLVHLLWAALFGTISLALLGLRPLKPAGYLLSLGYALLGALALVLLNTTLPTLPDVNIPPSSVQSVGEIMTATPQPTALLSQNLTPTPTASPFRSATPSPSPTRTRTLLPSATATQTITPVPTPVWAYVSAGGSDGALIRAEARYDAPVVQSLLNGTLVEVLPDVLEGNNVAWVHVRTIPGKEGWIVRTLLRTATPAAGW